MIEFYLNGQPQTLEKADPNLSILAWLRTKMRLTGTKEGCASGDCGACTVAIGTLNSEGRLRYESVNSCIALLGSLHGKHLVTIDGLQGPSAHPVQQAMVECHGSQCGFCTPGIIMSLVALHFEKTDQADSISEHQLLEALSGNLCRCTGYRPIIEAGRQAMAREWVQEWVPAETPARPGQIQAPAALDEPAMVEALQRLDQDSAPQLADADLNYQAPNRLEDLLALLAAERDTRIIAGGTDLALEITQQLKTLPRIVSVQRVAELRQLVEQDSHLDIGAALTYREFGPTLTRDWPAFGPMLERLGSRQIRNRGTLGGNIGNASPIGDTPPALIALGAELQLSSADGDRWLALEEFFTGYKQTVLKPGEVIRQVLVPKPRPDEQLYIHKISKRLDDDISAVLGAFWFRFDGDRVADCRLAFGGMAAVPARALQAEKCLRGQILSDTTMAAAAQALSQDFTPMSDVRGSAAYRLQVAGNLLRRTWLELSSPEPDADGIRRQPLMVTDYA